MDDVYLIFPVNDRRKQNLEYQRHITRLSRHPRFNILIKFLGPLKYRIPIWKSIDDAILYAVIGQMLSSKASASIIKGLIQKFGSSSSVIQWAEKNFRKKGPVNGVSQRKRQALREWALYVKTNNGIWRKWKTMPLPEYRKEICTIWGFGRWSADMIAIFHLGRMDIWPENDSGINKSCKAVLGCDEYDSTKKYIAGSETVAALYLWELLNRNLLENFKRNYNG